MPVAAILNLEKVMYFWTIGAIPTKFDSKVGPITDCQLVVSNRGATSPRSLESESSPSPACLESSLSFAGQDSSPSRVQVFVARIQFEFKLLIAK